MLAPITATLIFVAMFILIIIDKIPRHIVTLSCALLTIVTVFLIIRSCDFAAIGDILSVKSFAQLNFWWADPNATHTGSHSGIDWSTIIFLGGMMVMVEGMAKSGFFRWLCMFLAKLVNYKTVPLFITFMIMSSVLAMFIDSITVILFLAAVTIELSRLLKFDPVMMILSEIFCANLGGSATMCGDPPNIIIGSALGYSFADFLLNTGLIALLGLIAVIIWFYFVNRKELANADKVEKDLSAMPSPASAIVNMRDFVLSVIIFALAVILLVTHAQTGLTVASIGLGIAILTLAVFAKDFIKLVRGVDYKTLLFFVGLFVVVGGLEQTGVLKIIADFIAGISGGNVMIMCLIIIWFSGLASAFVDNIPFAATMVPIITGLSGGDAALLATLAWSLAMGTDIGGCATPIGASANVVGTSVAAKNGHIISWGKYCKEAVPATVIVLIISTIVIFVRYCI